MKKILFLLVMVVAINHVHAKAMDEPKSPVGIAVVKSGTIFKLFYRGEKTGTVKVSIYNAKGQAVFVETLRNTEHFMRPYNFSSLPEGNYTIELSDEQGKRVKNVTHSFPTMKRVAHLGRLAKTENKFLLTVPNKGRSTLLVKIFDERNTLLYYNTEIMNGNFGKVYNMNNVNGEFTFEITDQAGKYNHLTTR